MNNNIIDNYQYFINNLLSSKISDIKDSRLKQSIEYSLLNGGKRLRPILFLSLLESLNIDPSNYTNVACAIEMIHTYSLVHDDLPSMDNDTLRRNKPTTHIKFDEATAILCGDALLTDAFYLLSKANIKPRLLIKLIRTLSLAAGSNGMVLGQQLDIEDNPFNNKNINDIELLNYYKTTRMLEASISMAAMIANKDLSDYLKLATYLGQAFQLQDDLLEYTNQDLGKDLDSDTKNNKKTMIKIIGVNNVVLLIEYYFNEINDILHKLELINTKFHLVILEIADRNI